MAVKLVMKDLLSHCCLGVEVCLEVLQELAVMLQELAVVMQELAVVR